MKERIIELLENVKPTLQADGGDIEFVKYENNILYVKLIGACSHCPMATQTLHNLIERYVKENIPEVLKVINED